MAEITVKVSDDKEVVVSERKKYKTKHKFIALGMTMYNEDEVKKTAHIMMELSVSAHWLIWNLIAQRDYNNNVVKMELKNLSSAEKQRGARGYKELKDKKLAVRIDKSVFLINPDFILPNFNNYQACKEHWDYAVNQEVKDNE